MLHTLAPFAVALAMLLSPLAIVYVIALEFCYWRHARKVARVLRGSQSSQSTLWLADVLRLAIGFGLLVAIAFGVLFVWTRVGSLLAF